MGKATCTVSLTAQHCSAFSNHPKRTQILRDTRRETNERAHCSVTVVRSELWSIKLQDSSVRLFVHLEYILSFVCTCLQSFISSFIQSFISSLFFSFRSRVFASGVRAVVLSNFLQAVAPFWDKVTSFTTVDDRVGVMEVTLTSRTMRQASTE